MVPTNRLRQVPIYRIITHNIRESTPTGYKLQQWWSVRLEMQDGTIMEEGEWRDVEIVEE